MELKTAIEILEYHQEWRLGKREDMIHEPKKLTEALDVVLKEVIGQSEKLVDFLLHLNDKGLINDHDFDYEKEAKEYLKKKGAVSEQGE